MTMMAPRGGLGSGSGPGPGPGGDSGGTMVQGMLNQLLIEEDMQRRRKKAKKKHKALMRDKYKDRPLSQSYSHGKGVQGTHDSRDRLQETAKGKEVQERREVRERKVKRKRRKKKGRQGGRESWMKRQRERESCVHSLNVRPECQQ